MRRFVKPGRLFAIKLTAIAGLCFSVAIAQRAETGRSSEVDPAIVVVDPPIILGPEVRTSPADEPPAGSLEVPPELPPVFGPASSNRSGAMRVLNGPPVPPPSLPTTEADQDARETPRLRWVPWDPRQQGPASRDHRNSSEDLENDLPELFGPSTTNPTRSLTIDRDDPMFLPQPDSSPALLGPSTSSAVNGSRTINRRVSRPTPIHSGLDPETHNAFEDQLDPKRPWTEADVERVARAELRAEREALRELNELEGLEYEVDPKIPNEIRSSPPIPTDLRSSNRLFGWMPDPLGLNKMRLVNSPHSLKLFNPQATRDFFSGKTFERKMNKLFGDGLGPDATVAFPIDDPEAKRLLLEGIEESIEKKLGSEVRSVQVRHRSGRIEIRAPARHFWKRIWIRKTIRNLPCLDGLPVEIDVRG